MTIFALILGAAIASAPAPAGVTVSIDTTAANEWAGSHVDVEGWNRPDVSIEQEVVNGKESDVRPVVERHGATLAITAEFSGPRKSTFFGLIHENTGEAFRWIVHVPAGNAVTVRESNGGIDANGVTAPLDVHTSNGRIAITGAGPVLTAHTSNGTIDATIATLRGGAPNVTIRSSNGWIHLRVPHGFAARVEAHTSNGRVTNPLEGANGAGSVTLHTSNGSIEVTPAG